MDKRRIILGEKYFSFLEMVGGAKQKKIDVLRKNQSKTNLFTVKQSKERMVKEKKQG